MAQEQQGNQPSTSNQFTGGMVKDMLDGFLQAGSYTHARNASTNLPDGQLGGLSTECATSLCIILPYTLIGAIPLADDQWCVYLTDNITSEIGIFTESQCSYTTLTGPQTCPRFSKEHLIIGASRRGYDCGYDVYWSEGGYNPDRFINTAKVPFIQVDTTPTGPCRTYVDTTVIDCEKLRLQPHFTIPCLKLAKSQGSGTLRNGSYQVAVRYAINEIPCTDFVALSPIESLFSHNNLSGALRLSLSGTESTIFTEMEIVLISMVNFQVEARRIGTYSTAQTTIYIDDLDLTLPIVPLETIPLNTPSIESCDGIYSIGQYLTRVGVREKPQFNYQPLANQIQANWVCVEYPDTYYYRGGDQEGMNVGSMRDEVYAYYIRWVWLSGDKTASYNIPGLPEGTSAIFVYGGPSTGDSGTTIAHGRFAGYSSTELYDDRHPAVWGSLCGLPIMHHKFPDQTLHPELSHFTNSHTIRIMGVYFENIQLPVDNNGNIIRDIQGYEILRAVRDGHKSVIAKGMVNHMRAAQDEFGAIKTLYQNYPYDDLHSDKFLTRSSTIGTVGGTVDDSSGNEQDMVMHNIATFHSPDTSFQRPNLGGAGFLVLYQAMAGIAQGSFDTPYQHPKFKLLNDKASALSGIIASISFLSDAISTISGGANNNQFAATEDVPINTSLGVSAWIEGPVGVLGDIVYAGVNILNITLLALTSVIRARGLQQQIMNIINGLVPPVQYARQYDSYGFYDKSVYKDEFSAFDVIDYQYVSGYLQTFAGYNINNLYRNNYVALQLTGNLPDFPAPYNFDSAPAGTNVYWQGSGPGYGTPTASCDHSRFTLAQGPPSPLSPGPRPSLGPFLSPIVSWYGAYKVPQLSQYGQVDSPKQILISCMQQVDVNFTGTYTTPVLFGGDTYINRYTEKNPFFFFNDWLYGQPPDYTYDYSQYENVPFPRYWINNSKIYYDFWSTASRNWHLDELDAGSLFWSPDINFYVKSGYFYLFNNGVRDFYVESEVNVGYRDWEDDHSKRFYDPYGYTTLEYMFRSDIIKSDILYKYDYSLSASKFWNNYISWGQCLRRDYDPVLAYTCFSYYPRRLHYSLSQSEELLQDNWRIFLPNNYINTPGIVTAIEEVNETGALILMADRAPGELLGTQSIPSSSGTEYTVGSGSLFKQQLTAVSNADQSLQYGSCQNRLSILNTPHGLFWVSRDTGKVFNYAGEGMQDITPGMKWHLSRYLPSQLLQQYPDYPLSDNPVAGIGVQCVYDNTNEVLYICKKDFKALDTTLTVYNSTAGTFQYRFDTGTSIILIDVDITDPLYFEDCSWTLSYDCKKKQWVSFHDWYPGLSVGSGTHFLTTNIPTDQGASLHRHNNRTDLFCQYYGVDYPWEIGYQTSTGIQETTLQNLFISLESYRYRPNSTDKFQVYNEFFSNMIVWNAEQNSFMTILQPKPWDNPYAALDTSFFTGAGYNTFYSKVENLYKVNDFYDFTNDRFQFGIGTIQAFNTDGNGYTFTLNNAYFDTNKAWNMRKKFRYRGTNIFLRRNIVGENAMTIKWAATRNQQSFR